MNDASAVRAGESLLLGNGAQLRLLELDDLGVPAAAYEALEARGRFTGERLFSANPQLYEAISKLIVRDVPYREIGEICGVSVNTVCGVAWREKLPIETLRQRIGRIGLDVAQLTIEAMRELLADPELRKKVSAKDLSIIFGIVTEKAQLVLGGPTARIENTEVTAPSHDDYLEFLKNVTPVSTGSTDAPPPQKEPLLVELPAAAPSPENPPS